MPKKEDNWEEIVSDITRLEIGDIIEGEFIGMKEGSFGDQPQIKNEDGVTTLPSLTVLMTKFSGIEKGSHVRVERIKDGYSEKRKTEYQDFSVKIKKGA